MTSSFNFQDSLKWSLKKCDLNSWEAEVKKGRETINIKLDALNNDASFTVLVRKNLFGRFLDFFKKKPDPSKLSHKGNLFSKKFENVNLVKFSEEKKRLVDLIKRKTSVAEILSTVNRDFPKELSKNFDSKLSLSEDIEISVDITPFEDLPKDALESSSQDLILRAKEEELRVQKELQLKAKAFEEEIENLSKEIKEAELNLKNSCCLENAIKTEEIALKKIEELKTSLEVLKPDFETITYQEDLSVLSSNIQDFQEAILQRVISDISLKSNQANVDIAKCSDSIRQDFETRWSKLESEFEPILSLEDARKKETELNRLIEVISEDQKNELLEKISHEKDNIVEILREPLNDLLSTKDWLNSINELRGLSSFARQKAWNKLEYDILNTSCFLNELESLNQRIDHETQSDQIVEQFLSKVPRNNSYKALAYDAAWLVSSFAGNLVMDMFKSFKTEEPISISQFFRLNDVMASYLKIRTENLEEDQLNVLLEVFAFCHYQKKIETVNSVEDELKTLFQAGMSTAILARSQKILENLRLDLDARKDLNSFISNLKSDQKNAVAKFQDLQVLESAAFLHDHYKNLIKEKRRDLDGLTGNEKEQAKSALVDLESKVTSELEWLANLDQISISSVETIKYKLHDLEVIINGIFGIEEQKKNVRKEIDECIADFNELFITYEGKVSELESQYTVNLESVHFEMNAVKDAVLACKDETFFDLNLKETIALQKSLYEKVKSGMHVLEVTSLIDDAYKAMNDLELIVQEADAVKNDLLLSSGIRQPQIFNSSLIDKKIKIIEHDKLAQFKDKTLTAKEFICFLKLYTSQTKGVVSYAKKMQILSFQEQIKKFESRQIAIQNEMNKEPLLDPEVIQELEIELQGIKLHLLSVKKMLIKSLESKMQDHRKAMSEVTRPLRMSGEIYVKALTLVNETENEALQKIPVEALKNHIEKVLNFTRYGGFNQESIEDSVIEAITSNDFRKTESLIEKMIEVNMKHASLIRESTLAAEKAKNSFHQVREKTNAMIEELSDNDQFVEKAVLEQVLKDVEKDVEKLSDYDSQNFNETSFWDLSNWNIAALWNKAAYEVTKATEKQSLSYGKSAAKLLSAIDRAKAAPTLSIPDQLLDLSYILPEKRAEAESEMRSAFSRKMKSTLRQAENDLENYENSFNDILGRFYIPRNGRFRKDIEEFIKLKHVELNSLKKEYSNTFWWVPRKAFEYFNLVKMTENITEMIPSVMRTYEKDVTTFTKNLKSSLDKSFPIATVAKSHKNFENAYLKAKSEAVFYRSNSQFLHAYKVEKQALHINETFKKDWDRPKVTSIAELRSLNVELIKCANAIDRGISATKSEARTPIPLTVQLDKLNKESPESREAYEALKANIEALKEDAIETIKSKIKDHRNSLVNASSDFSEIAEKFNLPSQWIARIAETVNKELDIYSEDYSVSRYLFFTKNVEDFSASEAALNATKIINDCTESLKRVFQPEGIGVGVELKGLRDSYKKYKSVMTKIESTRDNLIRQGQYLYVSKLDADVKKAEDAFKALDENLPPNERIKSIKEALSHRAMLLQDVERIANTSKILTAKEQFQQLPENFGYHDELQVYRADQIKVKTEKQKEELSKQIEAIENIVVMPIDWKLSIIQGLKDCKNQLSSIEEGVLVEGYFGSKTLKTLEEINSEDATVIENQLESIERRLQNIDREYGVKDLISHDQTYTKLLIEAEDLKSKLSIAQSLDIETLIARIKARIVDCIQFAADNHPQVVVRIREFSDTLRLQNTALSSGLKKIQADRPSSGAKRLLTLEPGSAEYIKCKKGLQDFTAQQLLNLNKAIDSYDQRIDEIEKKLQAVTSAETVLTEDWKRDAYSFIRLRKDYVSKLQKGLPHFAADGSLVVKLFADLTKGELVRYEQIVMQYVGAQTTFVQDKDKNSDEYSKGSALFILESVLHLVDLEKTANSLSLQVNRLKANATHSERANQDVNKSIVLNAGKEVFKKLIEYTAADISEIGHTQTLTDVLDLSLASMTRMNMEFSSLDRMYGALSQDPWVTLYLYDIGKERNFSDAKKELFETGFQIRYKTSFSDATRGSGWEDKFHNSLTSNRLKEVAIEKIDEFYKVTQENIDRRDPEHPKVKWLTRLGQKFQELKDKLQAIDVNAPVAQNRLFDSCLASRTDAIKEINEVFHEINLINISAMEGMGVTDEEAAFMHEQPGQPRGIGFVEDVPEEEKKHDGGPPVSPSTSTSSSTSTSTSTSSTSTSISSTNNLD